MSAASSLRLPAQRTASRDNRSGLRDVPERGTKLNVVLSKALPAEPQRHFRIGLLGKFRAARHLVAWLGGVGALSPTRVPGYAMRTYFGRPSSNIRLSTPAAMATSLACRPSVCERSPSPMTRFQRAISHSTRARQL